MRRHTLLLFVLALTLVSAPWCFAQQILPDHFGAWKSGNHPPIVMWPRSPESEKYDPHPEYTQLLVESGVTRIEEHYYQKGEAEIAVRAFKLYDPSGAYEVYTSKLDTDMEPSTVGPLTAIGHDQLVILIGNFVLDVSQPQLASTADLKELAGTVRKSADATPLPPIRTFLPQGFADGTQRYALGPAAFQAALGKLGESEFAPLTKEAGFDFGAEAIFANYQKAKESGVLLLIDYPTPQLAEQHLRHLDAVLSPAEKQAGTTVERKGSLLSLVLRPPSAAFAAELRSDVHYQTEVTWNEPTHKLTDPPWVVILGRILIFTLLFMGLTIAVGAAFGGVRVLLKTFFPGKVFDRPGQMDVLQLGLSSKRIDSRDFY